MTTRRVMAATLVLGGLTLIACNSKTPNKALATTTITEPFTVTTVPHPFLNITLDPQTSGRSLVLAVTVDGLVPQLVGGSDGRPIPGSDQDLRYRVDFGDGTQPVGGDGGAVACRSGAPLVRMHHEFPGGPNPPPSPGSNPIHLTHSYAHGGSYTVTYTDTVCELGDVSKTTSVTVG